MKIVVEIPEIRRRRKRHVIHTGRGREGEEKKKCRSVEKRTGKGWRIGRGKEDVGVRKRKLLDGERREKRMGNGRM